MSNTEIDLPSSLEVHGTTIVESSATGFKFKVPVDMASQALTGLPNGSADKDAATKGQLDAASSATYTAKNGCRVKADSNITLSDTQTIDGVALSVGDRVLVAGQTSGSANGIYVVASGAWSRASDMAALSSTKGVNVAISSGTVNAGTAWIVTSGSIVGSDVLTFSRLSPAMTQSFTVPGTSTWTKPAGCTQVTVVVYGGGGGGASGCSLSNASANLAGGGGGGGGACSYEVFDASSLSNTVTVTVGSGGSGGAVVKNASGNNGATGGTSSFGTYAKAYGGSGGRYGSNIAGVVGGSGGGTKGPGLLNDPSNISTGGEPVFPSQTLGIGGGGASGTVGSNGYNSEYGGSSGGGGSSTAAGASGTSIRGGTGGGGGGGLTSGANPNKGGSASGVSGTLNAAGTDGASGTSLIGGSGGVGGSSGTTGGYAGGNGGVGGGGGGGGGATISTYFSGKGGNGGSGAVYVICE